MNRVYRLVWSNLHQCLVTASEISKAGGKGKSSSLTAGALTSLENVTSSSKKSVTTLFRQNTLYIAFGLSVGLFNLYGGDAIAACVTSSGDMTCTGTVGSSSDIFGLEVASPIGTLNNNGTILSHQSGIFLNSGRTITTFNNTGTLSSDRLALEIWGSIGTLNNSGSITKTPGLSGVVDLGVYHSRGTIGLFNNINTGTISGVQVGIQNDYGGTITELRNSGSITASTTAIQNGAGTTITTINNSGSLTGGASGSGIDNRGSIGALNNNSRATVSSDGKGLYNSGAITTINNSGSIVGGLSGSGWGILNDGTIGTITNSSTGLIQGYYLALENFGAIASIANSGSMIGVNEGIFNQAGHSIGQITNNAGGTISGTNSINSHGTIDAITNSGTISGNTAIHSYNTIGSITNNSGGTISGSDVAIHSYSTIGSITNNSGGTISGGTAIYNQGGSITGAITNTGTISGTSAGISNTGTIASIVNNASGSISGATQIGINNSGTITALSNAGTISGTVAGVYNTGTISSISNTGSGSFSSITNSGTIRAYSGILPSSYKILFSGSSVGEYGKISFDTVSGSLGFGISSNSSFNAEPTTYLNVLSGIASAKLSALSGSVAGTNYTWQLRPELTPTSWDLVVSAGISSVSPSQTISASDLSGSTAVALTGGTITASAPSATIANPLAINSPSVIDTQNGARLIISGELSGASKLSISNSAGTGGVIVLAADNPNFSGGLSVGSGANVQVGSALALGTGSLELVGSATTPATLTTTADMTISNPITVSGDPVFNVSSGTTTTVSSPIADGSSSGDVVVTGGGTLNLTAVNTYTGATSVSSGATLALSGSGAIATSSGVTNNGTFDISATTSGATVQAISGSGAVALGAKSLTVSNASGDLSGIVAGTGGLNITGGSQTLSGANTYTGATSISSGATLALSGSGAIATSSGVTNSGTFSITGKTANVSVASYTQASTGNLAMNYSPTSNQKLLVTGAASLAGGLTLTGSSGTYSSGRYALLTAGSVSGAFGSLSSNLSSLTTLGYSLAYDSSNVYLVFTPNAADTQQSLVNTASVLQNTYALQNSVLANSFSYDCTEFGVNNVCISAGGRNTAVSAANGLNNTSALLIAAYRPHPNYRIGAYADQNLSVSNPGGTVNLGNNTPLIGLFGAWNQRLDGTGTEIKVSAAYGQKNTTITRSVVGTSEPGTGSSQLNSQGAQLTAKYGFAVSPAVIVSPYAGIRYTQNNMNGYTEATSATVTAPLTYAALNTNATTALAGLGASYKVTPVVTTFAGAGIETDTNTSNGTYSATGISGLTPINFNANPVKTRPTATLGAYYDVAKNQRLGVTGIYRQEPYQAVSTTTVMATYTIGL